MFLFKKVPSVEWSEVDKKDFIIDVRSKEEFKMNNVRGVKNVPLDTIANFNTDKKVYVMCHSGARSKSAVDALRKRNIDAYSINGGIMAYEK